MAKETKKERKKKALKKKHIILWVIAGVVVVAVVVALGVWVFRSVVEQEPGQEVTREEELAGISTDAERAASESDDPTEAAAIYDEAVANTDDNREKSELLASKATAFFNAGQHDEALKAALEAEKAQSTASVSALIAQIYEAQGSSQKAADYYRKAAGQVDDDNPMSESDRNYYNMKADELGGEA